MEGDKVSILSVSTEVNGQPVFETKIGEKPQFMFDGEYHQTLIECAYNAVLGVCEAIYRDNKESQVRLANMIAKRIENK